MACRNKKKIYSIILVNHGKQLRTICSETTEVKIYNRFKKLLEGEEELPFVAFFKTRKIIIRDEFEEYMEDHPEIMEDLKNGKARIS